MCLLEPCCYGPHEPHLLFLQSEPHPPLEMAVETEEIAKVKAHRWQISCLDFRADGFRLASGSWDKEVRIWDLSNLEVVTILKGAHRVPITSLSWEKPEGRLLSTGSADHTAVLWNTETGTQEKTLAEHSGWVLGTSFSTNSVLATSSWDKSIGIWDSRTGGLLNIYKDAHSKGVWSVDFHPHFPEILCSSGEDGSIKIWDLRTGKVTRNFTSGHSDAVVCAKWSPDGTTVASGSADTKVKNGFRFFLTFQLFFCNIIFLLQVCIWEVGTEALLNTVHGHTDTVKSLAFNPNTDAVVPVLASAGDFAVRLSDPRPSHDMELLTLTPHTLGKEVEAVGISPDGSLIVSGGRDGCLVFLTLSIPSLRPQYTRDNSISEKLRHSQNILDRSYDQDSTEDLHEEVSQISTSEGDLSLAASREDILLETSQKSLSGSRKVTGPHRKEVTARASRLKRTQKKVVDLPSMIAHLSASVTASMIEEQLSSSESEDEAVLEERETQKISALIGVAQKVDKYSQIATVQEAARKAPDPRFSLLPETAPMTIQEKRKFFESKEALESTDGGAAVAGSPVTNYNEYSGYSSLMEPNEEEDSDTEDGSYAMNSYQSTSRQRSFAEIGSEEEYYGDDIPFSMI